MCLSLRRRGLLGGRAVPGAVDRSGQAAAVHRVPLGQPGRPLGRRAGDRPADRVQDAARHVGRPAQRQALARGRLRRRARHDGAAGARACSWRACASACAWSRRRSRSRAAPRCRSARPSAASRPCASTVTCTTPTPTTARRGSSGRRLAVAVRQAGRLGPYFTVLGLGHDRLRLRGQARLRRGLGRGRRRRLDRDAQPVALQRRGLRRRSACTTIALRSRAARSSRRSAPRAASGHAREGPGAGQGRNWKIWAPWRVHWEMVSRSRSRAARATRGRPSKLDLMLTSCSIGKWILARPSQVGGPFSGRRPGGHAGLHRAPARQDRSAEGRPRRPGRPPHRGARATAASSSRART